MEKSFPTFLLRLGRSSTPVCDMPRPVFLAGSYLHQRACRARLRTTGEGIEGEEGLLASPALPPLGFLVVPLPGAELRHLLFPPALFLSSEPCCPRAVSLDDHFRTLVRPQLELVVNRRGRCRARHRLGPVHVHRIPETVFPRRRPGVPRSALLAWSAAPSGLSPWAGSQSMHVSISAQPTSC